MRYLLMSNEGVIAEGQNINDFIKGIEDKSLIGWLDLESPKRDDLKELQVLFDFHPFLIKSCRKYNEFPKYDIYGDVSLLVLQGIVFDELVNQISLPKVCLIIGRNYFITIRYVNFESIHTSWHNCKKNFELIGEGIEGVVYRVLDDLVNEILPILSTLDNKIESIEDEILIAQNSKILDSLVHLRRNIIRMLLSVQRQIEVFNEFGKENAEILSEVGERYYKDIKDHYSWIKYNLDLYKDLLESIFDAYFSMLSNKLNKKSNNINKLMQRFTVTTTIFLPLTFLTGIYGMNFNYIPELQLHYGYFYFWILIIFVSILLYFLFKRKKWLD